MGFHGDFMGFHVQNPWLMINFGDYTIKNNRNHPRTGNPVLDQPGLNGIIEGF
jgi:hypothetical protein